MHWVDPQFPPLLKGHGVDPPAAPLSEACRRVRVGELGAGDIVFSRSSARAALAIVLEPEVALARALQMAPLLMVALGDCLGSLGPPQLAVQYRWPRVVLLNGTPAGEVRIAVPRVPASQVPNWLVVGVDLAIADPEGERRDWSQTSLAEAAGSGITAGEVLRSLAAHFLHWINTWQDTGFRKVRDQWLLRAEGCLLMGAQDEGKGRGAQVIGLEENCDLLRRTAAGKVERHAFIEHVERMEGEEPQGI
jgi:biotin-(acetyl-CoA carboxylase) ligase